MTTIHLAIIRSLLRFYPLNTPRAGLLRRLPAVPEGYGSFKTKHGRIKGYYSGHDLISSSLFWLGDFDPWVDQTLRRLTRPGDVALDIGANIGSTSIVLARAVGALGRVIAFEPIARSAKFFRENMAANSLPQVHLEEVALTDHDGDLVLSLPPGQPGMALATNDTEESGIRVQARSLDCWLADHTELQDIATCKIDVEGHELSVFTGSRNILSADRIKSVVFESHRSDNGNPVFRLLREYGYRCYRICKSPIGVSYVEVDSPFRKRPTSDYVAIKPDTESARRLGLP